MGYEQQFLEARKGYHQKIQTFQPSKTLMAIIDEDKPKQLAHKLDENKSKPFKDMDQALNVFDAYRLAYIKKITDQIAKESQANHLRPTINLLMAKMEKICDDFQKECNAKSKAEFLAAKAAEEAKKDEEQDLKDDLTKITDEYKKRGDSYLTMASKVEKDWQLINKVIIREWQLTKTALDSAKHADTAVIKNIETAREAALKKMNESYDKADKSWEELLDREDDDKNLTPQAVAKELRITLPDTAKPEIEKISKANGKNFARANEIIKDIRHTQEPETKKLREIEQFMAQLKKLAAGQK